MLYLIDTTVTLFALRRKASGTVTPRLSELLDLVAQHAELEIECLVEVINP